MAKEFDENKLEVLSKSLFKIQQKLIDKNSTEALLHNPTKIEIALKKVSAVATWKRILSAKHKIVSDGLVNEIFMDLWQSTNFACMGLYKQAHVSLRAALETTMRLVYFSTHPVEYDWWCSKGSRDDDVRSRDYNYFGRLSLFEKFDKKMKTSTKDYKLFTEVRNEYSTLSDYVHSSRKMFQTRIDRIAPEYEIADFNRWNTHFSRTLSYINTILILGFHFEFKKTTLPNQKNILKSISFINYKSCLRKMLAVKFRGRI